MNKKYDYSDFQKIVDNEITIQKVAEKYGTNVQTIHRQMNRAGYYVSKRKILIISPFKKIECKSVSDVANQLGISTTSVENALKGKRVKILEELGIELREKR